MNTEYATLKISRETAERWYNGDDVELKGLALTSFSDLEQIKPVVGEWYWDKSGCLYRCKSIEEDKVRHYNYWFYDKLKLIEDSGSFFWISSIDRIATDEEIFEAFEPIAREKGYYEKKYKCTRNSDADRKSIIYESKFYKNSNTLWISNGCPWKDGKWAEFVEDFKVGEMLAFSDSEDFRAFTVRKLGAIEKAGGFRDSLGFHWAYAKRIKYEFL